MLRHLRFFLSFGIIFVLSFNSYANLDKLFNKKNNAIIPASDAFQLYTSKKNNILTLHWKIAPKCHLYKKNIKLYAKDKNKNLIKTMPKAKQILIGENYAEVYSKELLIQTAITKKFGTKVTISYQGCTEDGFCYAPIKEVIQINQQNVSKHLDITNKFTEKKILIIGTLFILGILLAFTPCVFPMIPIVLNIITSSSDTRNKYKALALTLLYVCSMALVFSVLGIIAALLGQGITPIFQDPKIIIPAALILIFLSLSQLSYLPSLPTLSLQQNSLSSKQTNPILTTIFLGILSALVISPCTTAPLIGTLTYISQSKDLLLGGIALWFLGFGMGAPLLLIAVIGPRVLPKSGSWLQLSKDISGFLIIFLAIWFLSRVIKSNFTYLLVIIAMTFLAFHFKKIKSLSSRAISIAAIIYIVILISCYFLSEQPSLIPWKNFSQKTKALNTITTQQELDSSFKLAKSQKKQTILFFSAKWCSTCPSVEKALLSLKNNKNILIVKIDISSTNKEQQILTSKYTIFGPPAVLFFDKNSKEIPNSRIIGLTSADDILEKFSKP